MSNQCREPLGACVGLLSHVDTHLGVVLFYAYLKKLSAEIITIFITTFQEDHSYWTNCSVISGLRIRLLSRSYFW